jgi:hypothetical protein
MNKKMVQPHKAALFYLLHLLQLPHALPSLQKGTSPQNERVASRMVNESCWASRGNPAARHACAVVSQLLHTLLGILDKYSSLFSSARVNALLTMSLLRFVENNGYIDEVRRTTMTLPALSFAYPQLLCFR